jgi:hypothetical protein
MEYRSSVSVLGLPLVHVAVGRIDGGTYRRGVATGWIALGDIAFGIVLSCGGIAVGGISLGGAAVGILPMGGFALGLVALGGLSVGMVALGGAAIAWYAAIGGLAIAHDYAVGGAAFARRVVSPIPPDIPSGYPHPEAPFHLSDAFWLAAIVVALVIVTRRVREWREGHK